LIQNHQDTTGIQAITGFSPASLNNLLKPKRVSKKQTSQIIKKRLKLYDSIYKYCPKLNIS
jgi:hypothetical protein